VYSKELGTYRKVEKATGSPREIESKVLIKGAMKLKYCQEHWDSENFKERLHEALKYNQRIWTIFQADLGRIENLLPKDLKLNLLRLSALIDRHIFSSMARPSPESLNQIININLGIAAGLGKTPEDQLEAVSD